MRPSFRSALTWATRSPLAGPQLHRRWPETAACSVSTVCRALARVARAAATTSDDDDDDESAAEAKRVRDPPPLLLPGRGGDPSPPLLLTSSSQDERTVGPTVEACGGGPSD